MTFNSAAIVREIDSSSTLQTSLSRMLEIVVSDATVLQPGGGSAQLVVINAGAVRFGQDRDNSGLEDPTNEDAQGAEIDGVTGRRTVILNLRLTQYISNGRDLTNTGTFVGAGSLAALGNVGLTSETDLLGNTNFGVAVDNSKTDLTVPDIQNVTPEKNLWFFMDAIAEPSSDQGCQINRLGYQSWALVRSKDK